MKKLKEKYFRELLPYSLIFLVIIATLYVQIAVHSTNMGADNYFHFARFYDIKAQLMTGKFNWFQTNFTFEQTGKVINALYGPLFAYLNGMLLLVAKTWYQYEVITNILLNFIAAIGMYKLAQKVKAPKNVSVILALLYINTGMVPSWIEGMNFSAWGGVFIPYLLIQVVNLLEDKEKPIHVVGLMTCISLIANTHLLSTLLIVLVLAPVVLISFIKTQDKKSFIIDLLKVAVGTIILTASVWGGLLVIYSQNTIATPYSVNMGMFTIHLSHFQAFRQFIFPSALLLFTGQFIYAVLHCKKQFNNFVVTFIGYCFLLIGSKWFLDWNWIQMKLPIISGIFQFPFRLTSVAYPLILLGLAYTFATNAKQKKSYKEWNYAVIFSIFVMVQACFSTYKVVLDTAQGQNGENSISLVTQMRYSPDYVKKWTQSQTGIFDLYENAQPDYLPLNKKMPSRVVVEKYRAILAVRKKYQHIVNRDGSLTLRWRAKKQKKVTLPLVMYKQSRLIVNGKKKNKINQNDIGAPIIVQKKGENTVNLKFMVPLWFNILLAINILGWIVLIGYYARKKYLIAKK